MTLQPAPQDEVDLYQRLLRLPPVPRIVAGIIALAAGAASSVFLWDKGVIFGLTLFAFVAGLFLLISGIASLRHQRKRRALVQSIAARKEEILEGMLAARKEGKNPIRWLNEQGIQDPEIRTWFIEALKARTKE